MKTTRINGILVNAPDDADYEELLGYVTHYTNEYLTLKGLDIEFDGDYANVHIHTGNKPFERIRRITGYLVGTMPRWNDAKKAEEADRVKHTI